MARFAFPDNRFQSGTSVDGTADIRDDHIYSSLVLAHGGSSPQVCFTVPIGGTIPSIAGSGIAATAAHQLTYSDLTTNLGQAGVFGALLGDAAVYAIGVSFEQAAYTLTTGAPRGFGMTEFEVADVLSKMHFQLKVSAKKYAEGPLLAFPGVGGVTGSIATTGNAATTGVANNGWLGLPRRLRVSIPIQRTDTVQGIFTPGNGAALAFSTTSGAGQASLAWVILKAGIRSDAR